LGKEYHALAISLRAKKSEIEKEKQKSYVEKIKVYPNPANNKLFVTELPEGNNTIEIYDCYIRLIYKKDNSEKSCAIDL